MMHKQNLNSLHREYVFILLYVAKTILTIKSMIESVVFVSGRGRSSLKFVPISFANIWATFLRLLCNLTDDETKFPAMQCY
jgi:hypothetical protein